MSNFHWNVDFAELLIIIFKAKIKQRMNKNENPAKASAIAGPHQRKKTQAQLIMVFLLNVSENLSTHFFSPYFK